MAISGVVLDGDLWCCARWCPLDLCYIGPSGVVLDGTLWCCARWCPLQLCYMVPSGVVLDGALSPLLKSAALIAATLAQLSRLGAFALCSRVPSSSNVADGPSRLEFGPLRQWEGSRAVSPSFNGVVGDDLWASVAAHLCR